MKNQKSDCINVSVNTFYTALEELGVELSGFRKELDGHENLVQKRVAEFVRRLPEGRAGESGSLNTLVSGALEHLREGVRKWEAAVQRDLKGREFINRFEDSVIVVVAGKVKSGKSSLGNFIAGKGLPQTSELGMVRPRPRFRVHEATSGGLRAPVELDPEKGFAVDVLECTSQIQEVTIGGLSWVDTPGIHSLTPENGALAKEYFANAELVLYLTSSDSTLRRSDMDELKALLAIEKPLLIAVSRCDTVEEDLDDEGNLVSRPVPKPEKALSEQRAWIESQVVEAGLDQVLRDRGYAFLSTRLARLAVESGDPDVFETSGLPGLYERLVGVLSREAVTLKTLEPRRRFNKLIDALVSGGDLEVSIGQLRQSFIEAREAIEATSQNLHGAADRIARRTMLLARPDLERYLTELARGENSAGAGSELPSTIGGILRPALIKVFTDEVKRILKDMECSLSVSFQRVGLGWSMPEIIRKFDTISISEATAAGGKGSALGGLLGTIIGGTLGGPSGAAVGSMVGAGLGKAAGEAMAGTKEISVEVGTNVGEAIAALGEDLERCLPLAVSGLLKEISQESLDPMRVLVTSAISGLDALEKDLQRMKFELP